MEAKIKAQKKSLIELEEQHKYDLEKLNADIDEKIRVKTIELSQVTEKYEAIEEFWIRKPEIEEEVRRMKIELENEKRLHEENIKKKQQEKVQETEKLRRDMLYKIKETKAELLSLNETQLTETTKITI